jgi:hypothetical protein
MFFSDEKFIDSSQKKNTFHFFCPLSIIPLHLSFLLLFSFYPYLHIQKNTTCCDFHILCFLTEVYASSTLFITHFMCSNRVVGIAQNFLIFFAVFTNALACVSVYDILTLHSYVSAFFVFVSTYPPSVQLFANFGFFRAPCALHAFCCVLLGCVRCAAFLGHGFAVPGGGCTPGTP